MMSAALLSFRLTGTSRAKISFMMVTFSRIGGCEDRGNDNCRCLAATHSNGARGPSCDLEADHE